MSRQADAAQWRERVIQHLAEQGVRIDRTDDTDGEGQLAPGADEHREIASWIDHTLLKPDATREEIVQLCNDAKRYRFATVCVNGAWTSLAAELLHESGVGVATVVGFPLGATAAKVKAYETLLAIDAGATELDMVIHVGALKSGLLADVYSDIRSVVKAATGRALVKVILETGSLTEEEKITACIISDLAGADFVKTSTGFGEGGATEEDVALMNAYTSSRVRVKASGGVRTAAAAQAMIAAGAGRLGTSSGVQIVRGGEGQGY